MASIHAAGSHGFTPNSCVVISFPATSAPGMPRASKSDSDLPEGAAQHHRDNASAIRAQRHPHTDFTGPPLDNKFLFRDGVQAIAGVVFR